jgi:hypothetical protein
VTNTPTDPGDAAPPPEVAHSVEDPQSEVQRGESPPDVVRIDPHLRSDLTVGIEDEE